MRAQSSVEWVPPCLFMWATTVVLSDATSTLPLVPVRLCEGVFLFETIDLLRSRDLSERPSLHLMHL